jgi:transcriptional regulator with XRE-family HTH domain
LVAGYDSALLPTFGQNLRRLRKRVGLKAIQLAKKTSVQPPTVSAWENDKGGLPETPTLFKLAKALGCSIEELLQGVDAEYEAAATKRRSEASALFGDKGEIDLDDRDANERYNAAQELLAEARDAEEHARIAQAIRLTLAAGNHDVDRSVTEQERDHLGLWRTIGGPEQQAIEVVIRSLRDGTKTELDLDPVVRDLVEMFSSLDEKQQGLIMFSVRKFVEKQPGGVRRDQHDSKKPRRTRTKHGGNPGQA